METMTLLKRSSLRRILPNEFQTRFLCQSITGFV